MNRIDEIAYDTGAKGYVLRSRPFNALTEPQVEKVLGRDAVATLRTGRRAQIRLEQTPNGVAGEILAWLD